MTDIVKINVGGTIFQTTEFTLTKFNGYFRTMLETRKPPITKDESGAIFIDRSPKYFDLILNFMRDGHVDLQKYSVDVKEIQKEAEYYLLSGLKQLCAQKSSESQKTPYVVDSDNDIIKAVAESKKKAVLVILYDNHPANFSFVTELFMKWRNNIDFCFKRYNRERESFYYTFHDKIHNTVTRGYETEDLEKEIRVCFGLDEEDDYEEEYED